MRKSILLFKIYPFSAHFAASCILPHEATAQLPPSFSCAAVYQSHIVKCKLSHLLNA